MKTKVTSRITCYSILHAILVLAFVVLCGPSSPEEPVHRRLDAADLGSGDFLSKSAQEKDRRKQELQDPCPAFSFSRSDFLHRNVVVLNAGFRPTAEPTTAHKPPGEQRTTAPRENGFNRSLAGLLARARALARNSLAT